MKKDLWTIDRRKLLTSGGAFGAALALSPTMPRFAWAAEGDTLRIRMRSDMQVIDPAFTIGEIEEPIMRGIFVSLNRFGDLRDGSPWHLWGAETLEQTSDTEIRFTLIPGMTWTDGYGPVTADDVKFSFERVADPEVASPWAYQFEMLDHVEVVDERTGIIHLTQPYTPLFVTALPYYGGHIVSREAVTEAGGSFTTDPPAMCGPYLLDDWEPSRKVTMVANPDWPGPKPDFSTVELYQVADDQAALLAYEAGSYDYTTVPVAGAAELKENLPPDSEFIEAPSTRYMFLVVNALSPRLQDAKVREAIQHAIDVEQVLQGAFDGLTGRATGIVPSASTYARPENIIQGGDHEKARELLEEAGASDLKLTLHTLNDSMRLAVAQIVQASLVQAGIDVELVPVDEAAYWALGDKTQGEQYKELDLVLMDYAGGVDPSENFVWFRPDQVGVYNWAGFDSAEFEETYHQLISEPDEEKRIEMSRRMEDLMEQSGGFIFLAHEPLLVIHRDTIEPLIYPDGHPNPVFFEKS